ncbi:MAG: isoleucine--tRNA ligase [archaeon]
MTTPKNEAKELTEKDILDFWKKNKIYEKSKIQNKSGKKFYFMDGPPYATGHIHMGTALNKILKDIAMRSQRLQGKDVFDRAGYDTHGVPIEFKIEKEIGAKTKQDIEKYGVKKFIDKCKEFATKYIDVMNSEFENLGVWMDFKRPYLTLDEKYIETIWDAFKVADKKGLLYLGKYPVHICPRCETAVAFNEIEYSKQDDLSIFVKFQLKNKKNTFLIIWTTTPWTLPANTGVMVHPDIEYQELEISSGEKWIIAKPLVPKIMAQLEMGFTVREEFKGKHMEGWDYINPLSKNLNLKTKNAYKVITSSRYVTTEDGTGLVHAAPGHGKEDYEVGKKFNLDMPSPVDISGHLTEEAGKYQGKKARVVDEEIIKDLEEDNALVYKMKYSHDYPMCWRCHSALLMVSLPQWFLKISAIQKQILNENEKTEWNPNWMKMRMKAWLEGISDWPVSRKRYWGTPLPIWVCDNCNEKIVIGSKKELEKLSKKKIKDVHKPEIDKIIIPCQNKKCKGTMKRVEEVLDVWFDSGVSSWAALETEANIKKFWPADLNIEGKDQVRGWWNSQFILSQIKFNKKPFKSILEHGMVLDIGKKKMSKSLGNIISPQEIIDKHSRDYLRYYFTKI